MKIAIVSDSLSSLSLEELLDVAVDLGIGGVEVNTGNWSKAPHIDLKEVLNNSGARDKFINAFSSRGLELIALNANGNQLHPTDGDRQSEVVHDTIRLAGLLNVKRVCMMSGLPGGGPKDCTPNWIISSWPEETAAILDWQWNEKVIPYWQKLIPFAQDNGVEKICIELHGNQLVYNAPTLLRLRDEVGPVVGANLDPSHLMWMGADPFAVIHRLGAAIHHVHAKDTYLHTANQALTSLLDHAPMANIAERSWSYVTLGNGHDKNWWREFYFRLRIAGYNDWLSVEHEDVMLPQIEGVRRSIDLLRAVGQGAS